jgi:hypothetical protein
VFDGRYMIPDWMQIKEALSCSYNGQSFVFPFASNYQVCLGHVSLGHTHGHESLGARNCDELWSPQLQPCGWLCVVRHPRPPPPIFLANVARRR